MSTVKERLQFLFREEFRGWQMRELLWLFGTILVITIISILTGDSVFGIIYAATGIASVVLLGKGKLSSHIFGAISVCFYGIIAFSAGYFGSAALYGVILFLMEIIALVMWVTHMNKDTHEVEKRKLNNSRRVLIGFLVLLVAGVLASVLYVFGDTLPILDAFTTVATVCAMLLTMGRYAELWWVWIVVNILTLVLWILQAVQGDPEFALLFARTIFLVNSCIMCYRWWKQTKKVTS